MLIGFVDHLRRYRVPVSLREWLDLAAALRACLVFADLNQFYCLCQLCLVKDEKYFDRFDRAFAAYFDGLDDWQASLLTPAAAAVVTPVLLELLGASGSRQWQ